MRPAGLASAARRCQSIAASSSSPHGLSRVPLALRRYIASDSGAPRSVAKLLEWKPEGSAARDIVVNGYIRSVRSMKARTFVALGDGSSLAALQALIPADQAEGLAIGAAIRLRGSWVPSPGAGQSHELHVDNVQVLGPSDAKTFPIQKKYQTPEYLRTMPHLRPRTPFNSAILRFRSEVVATLTQFFASRYFVQTHPPVITSSDCEGGGEVFSIAPANKTEDETDESFFRAPKYLTVSSQLHLEALAQSVGDVWTLGPTFRAERSDTSRHLSEFYMLEAEMSFVDDLGGVMDLLEDMLRHTATELYQSRVARELRAPGRDKSADDSASDRASPDEVDKRWQGLMQPSWPRLTYTEALDILKTNQHLFRHAPVWGDGLQSEHEKYIARVVGNGKPVFVTHYPRDIKAFYMRPTQEHERDATSQETVDCFDLLVPEFCEIAGGSMREHRLPQLLDAMKRHGIVIPSSDGSIQPTSPAGPLDWYADLRRWGCPPHGGFGLGFDRLLGYLSGVQTIRDTVTFPRWYGRCDC
ncbi:asparaginyl-tRNA synthetase [Cryphonectria parasitica EP155]|uniref:asparagine--tRNA ligase n=1 Tax=Cryphonectria parasitica (strain ATCC 38755 / EP155) TaxID=660469 RepID=A0A9P4XY13_CRYP1|nr:asparaginyl-tRNA synthetase [Cryphonectria parasitica EP155]KAF3763093.1 asparaginyl-tRNA synthetase [Cryphonectria parasitica EP155]